MLTAQGPRLIEVGARLWGISNKALWNRCLGCNQVDLCLASYLNSDLDLSFLNRKQIKESALVLTLENEVTGKIIELPKLKS